MRTTITIVCFIILIVSCKKDKTKEDVIEPTGKIVLSFMHHVNGQPLLFDTLTYVNEAGNVYQINDLMYFISDVTLYKSDGTIKQINEWNDIYYIDAKMPATHTWSMYDKIPVGVYDSITFVFGITKEKNKSFLFMNAPEVNMAWPDVLGGGYHYMMINGKWIDSTTTLQNFNFHLGIGQIYAGNSTNVDSITGYVHNNFTVKLANSSFLITQDETKHMQLIMNIDNWFKSPHTFNFNTWGGSIMQNQAAMQTAKEN